MMNEILHEIEELEKAVDNIKKLEHNSFTINAIRQIDVMIDRKRAQVQAFEKTFDED
tara:strand:- start:1725 stop:1895 length:171 start_codon:yes stop_codon:yes gene_type:complete